MTLYILKYNNYFNRVIKKEASLEEYLKYQIGYPMVGINFIPNDGINTEQIINWEGDDPDYLLAVDDNQNIVSRWFVVSTKRERGGQYRLTLHRDVLADYSDEVLESTAYVKKGTVDSTNPLIYNSEGLSLNQIKQAETHLYDHTGTPWIVGYVTADATDLQGATIDFNETNAPLTNYEEIIGYVNQPVKILNSTPTFTIATRITGDNTAGYPERALLRITPDNKTQVIGVKNIVSDPNYTEKWIWIGTNNPYRTTNPYQAGLNFNTLFAGQSGRLNNILAANLGLGYSTSDPYSIYNGRIVKDNATDTYYKISVKTETKAYDDLLISSYDPVAAAPEGITSPALALAMKNEFLKNDALTETSSYSQFYWSTTYTEVSLSLTPVEYGARTVTLHDSARILIDAPYKMFCMPYNEENYMLAINLATNNGSKVLDVQLLPYCPVGDYVVGKDVYNVASLIEGTDYEQIKNSADLTVSMLFWASKSVFSLDIDATYELGNVKVQNECDMLRLCSPNGNGTFEFSPAKNNGLHSVNVDCTYRPYDPYIHLNPDFGGLYGGDFNDFRGLILNGDFSIPAINDSWVQYTIQNKNYQNIFDREIQTLELQNKYAKAQDWIKAATGGILAGGTGAVLGGTYGGLPGGIAGGVIGGAASLGAGIADAVINDKLRNDQIDLKKDLFNYNLQNIQAIPQSVTKTGCLTNNNKLVPYLELYSCTPEERTVVENKIKYTGMTIGAVGQIKDYAHFDNGEDNAMYIEADLIKIDIPEDYHVAMEIANELRTGARFA